MQLFLLFDNICSYLWKQSSDGKTNVVWGNFGCIDASKLSLIVTILFNPMYACTIFGTNRAKVFFVSHLNWLFSLRFIDSLFSIFFMQILHPKW